MRIGILFAVFLAFAVSITPAAGSEAEDKAAIRKTIEGIYTALNQHDAQGIAALCDDNLDTWEMARSGRQEVKQWVGEMVPGPEAGTATEAGEIGISFVTPDVAIQKSRREVRGQIGPDGKPLPLQKQLFLRIFVKKNGKWLLRGFFPMPVADE